MKSPKTEQDLLDMKLHELIYAHSCTIMRVYKGWTYTFFKRDSCSGKDQITSSSVFVPE